MKGRPQVVVIGGGFAGLSAAVALCRRGLAVTLLEQRPELGGRAYSFIDEQIGDTVDNGQHVMMGCYDQALSFLNTIGAADRLVFQDNMTVEMIAPGGRRARLRAARLPGPAHMVQAIMRYAHLRLIERVSLLVAGARILAMLRRERLQLERCSVSGLMDRLGQSEAARRTFWYPLTIAALNEEPPRASAALLAEVLRRAFFGRRRNSAFVYASVGLSELYCTPSKSYIERRGGSLITHAAVAAVELNGGGQVAKVRLREGREISADYFVSAIPWGALLRILPAAVAENAFFSRLNQLSSSPIICTHLWLDRPVIDAPFVGFIDTTTQWLFNKDVIWARRREGVPAHLSFVISGARSLIERPNQDLAAQVVSDLHATIPLARHAKVLRALVIKEKQATMAPSPESCAIRPPCITPLPNLFLAGDWVQTGLPATIESAVTAGHNAASAVATRAGLQAAA
jgi:squalene-associated FAD-dependent desaturase